MTLTLGSARTCCPTWAGGGGDPPVLSVGESEYAINGTAVRLQDVNELFMDTGLGQEGMPSLGRGKLMRFSRPKAPSGGKSSRRRRGSPIAATKRRRPSASGAHPGEPAADWGQTGGIELQRTPCRPRRNRPRPTWPCGELRVLEISFGWTSWTSSVLRVRLWKGFGHGPAGAGELLCPGRSALCQGGPFAAAAGPTGPGGSTAGPVPGQRSPAPGQPSAGGTSQDRVRANEARAQRTQADLAQQQGRRQALRPTWPVSRSS